LGKVNFMSDVVFLRNELKVSEKPSPDQPLVLPESERSEIWKDTKLNLEKRDLITGNKGSDVYELQKILNSIIDTDIDGVVGIQTIDNANRIFGVLHIPRDNLTVYESSVTQLKEKIEKLGINEIRRLVNGGG
jgi:hypothetical protein